MSSINSYFTFQYSQPEEYRFSHDSVFLARRVFEDLTTSDLAGWTGLDLCAGCGVVGLDFLSHCQKERGLLPSRFEFCEVQNVYEEHFQENVIRGGFASANLSFMNRNYVDLVLPEFARRYDLIVSNPPYFRIGQGKMSPSEFKNRCRFFIDSDFKTLFLAIQNSLKPDGRAYILLRSLQDHGFDVETEVRQILGADYQLTKLEDIRGTGLVLIKKNSR